MVEYEISKIKLTDLKPAEYNPRYISESEKQKLRNSLETFGLVDPIIINLKNNNKIVGGHQRYDVLLDMILESSNLAEKEYNLLKLGDVGLIFDDNLEIKNEDYEKALNLALNKISGEWDYSKLTNVLDDLKLNHFNLELTGFDDLELNFYGDVDLNPFDYDDSEEEVPDDFEDVEGCAPNESFTVILSFKEKESAAAFIKKLGIDKEITRNSIIINEDELTLDES